jgi:hypothetical protein
MCITIRTWFGREVITQLGEGSILFNDFASGDHFLLVWRNVRHIGGIFLPFKIFLEIKETLSSHGKTAEDVMFYRDCYQNCYHTNTSGNRVKYSLELLLLAE